MLNLFNKTLVLGLFLVIGVSYSLQLEELDYSQLRAIDRNNINIRVLFRNDDIGTLYELEEIRDNIDFSWEMTRLSPGEFKFGFNLVTPPGLPEGTHASMFLLVNTTLPITVEENDTLTFKISEFTIDFSDTLDKFNVSWGTLGDYRYARLEVVTYPNHNIYVDPIIKGDYTSTEDKLLSGSRIGRTEDGTLWAFLQNLTSNTMNYTIYNSSDGGSTWIEGLSWTRTNSNTNDHGVMIIDPDDPYKIHFIYSTDQTTANLYYRNFTIDTRTLSSETTAVSSIGRFSDAAMDDNGVLWAFLYGSGTQYANSTDKGETWSGSTSIRAGGEDPGWFVGNGSSLYGFILAETSKNITALRRNESNQWEARMINDSFSQENVGDITFHNNETHIVFSAIMTAGEDYRIWYTNSSDGLEYSPLVSIAAISGINLLRPQIANVSDGLVIVFDSENDTVYYINSTDDGITWSSPYVLCSTCNRSSILGQNTNPNFDLNSNVAHFLLRNVTDNSILYLNVTGFGSEGIGPAPTVLINNPLNLSYQTGVDNLTLSVSFNVTGVNSSYVCRRIINGTSTNLGSVANDTEISTDVLFSLGTHTVQVDCENNRENGTASVTFAVQRSNIVECGASDLTTLNLTMFDEEDKSIQIFGDMEILITSWASGNKDSLNTVAFNYTNTTSQELCVTPSSAHVIANATIVYGNKTTHPDREHYLVNTNLTNTTRDVDLFLLDTQLATFLEITVEDQSSNPQSGVAISIQRLYLNENNWSTIAMVLSNTDGLGETIIIDKRTADRTVFYRFVANQDGTIIRTTTGGTLSSDPDTGIITRTIVIGLVVGEYYTILQTAINTCTNTTSAIVCSYEDTTGDLTSMQFIVHRNQTIGSTVLCDETSTLLNHTFICNLGDTTNSSYYYSMIGTYEQGTRSIITSGWLFFGVPSIYGTFGAFVAFLMVIPLFFIGRWSPPVAIFLGMIGVIAMWAFQLLFIGPEAIIGLLIAGGIAMFLMRERRV